MARDCVSVKSFHANAFPRRFPSGAVPENLSAILADVNRFLVKSRREWDIHKISRLYAGEYYSVASTRELCFENCWVHLPSGTIVSSAKEIIAGSTVALGCFYRGHSRVDWQDAPWIEDECFFAGTCWGSNYAHWLFDSLPRLSDHVRPDAYPKLLLGNKTSDFQLQSLACLGWSRESLLSPEMELVRCRRLHVHMVSEASGVPHPECICNIRERLIESAGGTNSAPGIKRVYISRQKTRRKIVNHIEIEPVLRKYGFEEVFCEELSYQEQVRLFSRAEAVFGPHGAGTVNAMFAPKGAVLIEAFNPLVWDHAAHRLASLFGVSHYHLFGENASPEYDVRINPRTLDRTLALALDHAAFVSPELIEEKF
jgi:capsular polysaccharide biosynthesis protein